jgi:protein-S-isoprenylcysteine O-methyltransferase Ste14
MPLPFTIFFIGLTIGIYAVFNNGLGNFNIISEIKDKAVLVTHGLYRYIRHPMYLSVIIMMFATVMYDLSIANLTLYISLLLVVFLKAKREEYLWLKNHPTYIKYIKHTKMFIPFLL